MVQIHQAMVGGSKKRSAIVVIPNKIINTLPFFSEKKRDLMRFDIITKTYKKTPYKKNSKIELINQEDPFFFGDPWEFYKVGSYQLFSWSCNPTHRGPIYNWIPKKRPPNVGGVSKKFSQQKPSGSFCSSSNAGRTKSPSSSRILMTWWPSIFSGSGWIIHPEV